MDAQQNDIKLKYISNYQFPHQTIDGQCGMYCIYFIVRMLERKNQTPVECFEKICINGIDDDSMNRLRGSFFITDEN